MSESFSTQTSGTKTTTPADADVVSVFDVDVDGTAAAAAAVVTAAAVAVAAAVATVGGVSASVVAGRDAVTADGERGAGTHAAKTKTAKTANPIKKPAPPPATGKSVWERRNNFPLPTSATKHQTKFVKNDKQKGCCQSPELSSRSSKNSSNPDSSHISPDKSLNCFSNSLANFIQLSAPASRAGASHAKNSKRSPVGS